MDSLSFRIPEQHSPGKESIDVRPQAMQRWVNELPMGDTGEAARRLFLKLQQQNRLKLSPDLRAELLEIISPAFESVLNTIAHHYSGLSFPLPQKSVRIAKFATRLLAERVIAHHAVLNGREGSSWLFRKTHHQLWVESIHHMIVFLNRVLGNYRIIHRPPPAGVWQALHQLYLQAKQHGRTEEKVIMAGLGQPRTTIEQEYKRALLESLLEPQLFRRSQQLEVELTMPRWIEEVKLIPATHCHGELSGYCIRADQDAPHTVMKEQCSRECETAELGTLLDMSGVNKTINKTLARMGDESNTTLRGIEGRISRDTLEILQQCWRITPQGRPERQKSNRTVQAAIGMSANYMLMHRDASLVGSHGISDQEMSEALRPLFEDRSARSPQVTFSGATDVWDAVFFGTELGYNAWAKDAEEKNYQFITARELDYTETGHCLAFDSKDIESLQVGELLGFRESEGKPLQLCMVRWLQDNGETLCVGLQRIAAEVEPVLVVARQMLGSEEHKMAFGCLMGIGEDHRPLLFIPYLPGDEKRTLHIAVDGKELPITLYERVILSPLFKAYHFVAAEALKQPSTGDEIPLPEVNSRLHHIAHADVEPVMRERDDFSDVWDML